MKKVINRLIARINTDLGFILILGLLAIITFGIFIPFVGFYWDDWIWKFFSYAYSNDYLLWLPPDRPLAGTLHVVLHTVFRDNPIPWQIGNLFFRWANAAAFFWMLRKLLPGNRAVAASLSILFLTYPGFSEQWISIAFIHHLVPMTLLWLSFVLMFTAIETPGLNKKILAAGGSLLLAAMVMLTTEYFFGTELFRVVLIFYYKRNQDSRQKLSRSVWDAIKVWWPYATVAVGLIYWRTAIDISKGATYSVNLTRLFEDGFLPGLGQFFLKMFSGMYSSTVEVLLLSFRVPELEMLGQLKTMVYYSILAGGFVLGWWWFHQLFKQNSPFSRRTGLELFILGGLGLAVSGLPVWVSGLQYVPEFPQDRLGLSMMLGWSMLLVGLTMVVMPRSTILSGILACLLAFSVASNFVSGSAYIHSWEDQQEFWQQFVTRVPALEPGTVVITPELPPDFMSDLSYMMTLNWLYDTDPDEAGLDYGLFFGDTRDMFADIEPGMPIIYDRRMITLESSTDHVLVVGFSRNYCLYVFDSETANLNPNSRHVDPQVVQYSDQDRIDLSVDHFDNWMAFFDPIEPDNWCYYYELGELELQRGNYAEVARIGDLAFAGEEIPRRSWERAPFIEGYGFVERWDEAIVLTAEAMSYNFRAEELLCSTWDRLESQAPDSEGKQFALMQVSSILNCGNR